MHRAPFLIVGAFVSFLGLILLVAPDTYFQLYATSYVPGMDFPAQRFAPAVGALGIVLITARGLQAGPFVATLCLIGALAFLGVAATGVQAWNTGTARPAILGAAAVEVAVAMVFLWLWSRMRKV